MNHQEYLKAIEHEQTLIRRLFVCRKKRAEAIEKITAERYAHLIGKFFTEKKDPDIVWRINEVFTRENFLRSDQVDVVLYCSSIGTSFRPEEEKTLVGIDIYNRQFRMRPSDDIDELLTGRFVDKEIALERFNKLTEQLKINLNLIEKPKKEAKRNSRAAIAYALLSILDNEEGEPSSLLNGMDKYDDMMKLMGKVTDILNEDDIALLSSIRPNTWNHAIEFQEGADSILGPLPDF